MFWLMAFLQVGFWGSLLALAHGYAVYPALLRWLTRRLPPARLRHPDLLEKGPAPHDGQPLPPVVAFMAVYNEEAVLERTLESIVSSDYPPERLHVVIGSDHSTDASDGIVRRFQARAGGPAIQLQSFPGRCGKIRIINQLVEDRAAWLETLGRDTVFILCDANVRWSTGLVRQYVHRLRDERIGLVAANVMDASLEGRGGIAQQEQAYVDRENSVKLAESALWGCMMGAFGACYAVRARLFTPVPAHFIVDDFFQTMRCLEQGSDAVKDAAAICHETVSEDIGEEFRRKRRISTGNFQNLARFLPLYLPWRKPALSFAFWSHKGLRWLGPLFLLGMLASSAVLAFWHWFYLLAFLGQTALMLAAWLEGRLSKPVRVLRFARYFYLMNFALLLGGLAWLRGVKNSVWEPTRRVLPVAG